MKFSKKTILKLGLPLVLAVSVFSGTIGEAADTAPATAVQIQTFGTLPVMVFNLTQSPINFNMKTNSMGGYAGGAIPLAAGLSGVYYPQSNGATSTFTNMINPSVSVDGKNSASLMPVATMVSSAATPVFNKNNNYMNLLTVFPSWTGTTKYENVQYVALDNLDHQKGATIGAKSNSDAVLSGYPDNNPEYIYSEKYVSASAHSAAKAGMVTIEMDLMNNGQKVAAYNININSLGAGTSGYTPPAKTSMLSVLNSILGIVGDVTAIAATDGLAIAGIITGLPATIDAMQASMKEDGSINAAYKASSKGINVSATATLSGGKILSLVQGDADSLKYEVQSSDGTSSNLPFLEQNAVHITTWRQYPPDNTTAKERSSADMLIVAVVNNGIYTSNQIQQYINSNNIQMTMAKSHYSPTAAHAHDTTKILGILSAIYQKYPQDAQKIIDMFGINGKYQEIKKDPNGLKNLHSELQAIFEKHKHELPAIQQYLTKLASK